MEYVLGIAIIIAAGVFAVALHRSMEQHRASQIRAIAEHLGFTHSPGGADRILEVLKELSLFKRGSSRTVSNVMSKQSGDAGITIFDYEHNRYTPGSLNPTRRFRSIQTVMLFEPKRGTVPTVDIHPRQETPGLGPEFLTYHKEHPMLDMESNGEALLVYESEIRHPPDDLEIVIGQGTRVFELLRKGKEAGRGE